MAGIGGDHNLSLFFQSGQPGKSILSQVPFSSGDRLAMSRLRIYPGVLSIDPPASDRGVQTESVDDPDATVHRLRLAGVHSERRDGPTTAASFYSANLSVGLARALDLLLDLSQHAVVSVRVLITISWYRTASGSDRMLAFISRERKAPL